MHSHKIKKKSDAADKLEIKKEKSELHPMSHYIDDRVEMVKQIFASLKPKTIKNLAPDFLKNASIEDMEELCLNELLGISTKRLTSIINATKCPTDTESDSDVHNIEEHISLEEISSESEEENRTKTKKPLEKKNRKKGVASNSQENTETAKEMSVLELLELQARARAIRSQLALEPIAKIEVDSDDSMDSNTNQSNASSKNKQSTEKSRQNNSGKRSQNISINGEAASSSETTLKRIKLKRNFRQREDDSEQDDSRSGIDRNDSQKEKSPISVKINENKEEAAEREKSPSPDVITILPSPETLCISDSSEDEGEKNDKSDSKDLTVADSSKDLGHQDDKQENDVAENNETQKAESEVEDGEILEKEDEDKSAGSKETEQTGNENVRNDNAKNENVECEIKEDNESLKHQREREMIDIGDEDKNTTEKNKFAEKGNSPERDTLDCNEDHHNDDVISLEHEELDYEMKDNIEEDEDKRGQEPDQPPDQLDTSHSSTSITETVENHSAEKMCDPIDFIELHDDSSENEASQQKDDNSDVESSSWNSRWLQSAKVSKILAASRLGNRVRDKIKQSKKAEQAIVESKPESPPPKETFSSNFEEGSMQQYQEILEREKTSVQNNGQ